MHLSPARLIPTRGALFCTRSPVHVLAEVLPRRLAALFPRLTRGLLGRLMLLNWMMLVLFYLVLVAPVLWSLRPAKMVTPY